MEKRKIIVVSSATQSQAAFESNATTLGELKRELDTRGIDYAGMTFLEGHSKLEMNLDDAILPSNIPYKGSTTNDLVFLLTTPQKKIRSGADRIHLYGVIKDNGLADAIKEKFGRNYTNVSTDDLADFLRLVSKHISESADNMCHCKPENTSTTWDTPVDDDADDDDDEAVEAMIEGLKHIIYGMTQLGYINPVEITRPQEQKPISDDEMKELFGDFFSN